MKSRFPPFLESDSHGGNFRVFYKDFGQSACHPKERYVKESWQDDLLRWICGFANAEGGDLPGILSRWICATETTSRG
jgi:hypothetical protein